MAALSLDPNTWKEKNPPVEILTSLKTQELKNTAKAEGEAADTYSKSGAQKGLQSKVRAATKTLLKKSLAGGIGVLHG